MCACSPVLCSPWSGIYYHSSSQCSRASGDADIDEYRLWLGFKRFQVLPIVASFRQVHTYMDA